MYWPLKLTVLKPSTRNVVESRIRGFCRGARLLRWKAVVESFWAICGAEILVVVAKFKYYPSTFSRIVHHLSGPFNDAINASVDTYLSLATANDSLVRVSRRASPHSFATLLFCKSPFSSYTEYMKLITMKWPSPVTISSLLTNFLVVFSPFPHGTYPLSSLTDFQH